MPSFLTSIFVSHRGYNVLHCILYEARVLRSSPLALERCTPALELLRETLWALAHRSSTDLMTGAGAANGPLERSTQILELVRQTMQSLAWRSVLQALERRIST